LIFFLSIFNSTSNILSKYNDF